MDPTTLIQHPIPVRNIILQLPPAYLSSLLTFHDGAFQPLNPIVTKITPKSMTVTYSQPLREPWANPLPRTATIAFTPQLPPIPSDSASEEVQYEWETACAARIREMEEEATRRNEGRSDIVVTRYLLPDHYMGWLSILQFVALTVLIFVQIKYQPEVLKILFEPEWKFNAAVLVHAAILVKKSRDVMNMNDKLRKHQVDKLPGWKYTGPWMKWLITCAFEGWRCAKRFEEEAARVGREMAAKEKKGK